MKLGERVKGQRMGQIEAITIVVEVKSDLELNKKHVTDNI